MDTNLLDQALVRLQHCKDDWATLPVTQKIEYLVHIKKETDRLGSKWVGKAVIGKQIDPDSPWVGEEWISGPWAFLASINGLIETLSAVAEGKKPHIPKVTTKPDGQVVAHVYPGNVFDFLLLNGITAEVWMEPEITQNDLENSMATFYDIETPQGNVELILGAGNIASIPPLDVLQKMFTEGKVAILKMNPINDYLGEIFTEIFSQLIEGGYLEIVYGGVDVGEYLLNHEHVNSIHLTGGIQTFNNIVFGNGEEGKSRKQNNNPIFNKPISSELGGVGPAIVIPGPWTDTDIKYQAERLVTMKLHNGGYNCVASQVLILPEKWDLSEKLLDAVRDQMASLPSRHPYYPGSDHRQENAHRNHSDNAESISNGNGSRTLITNLDHTDPDTHSFNVEVFGPVYSQTYIPGETTAEYLKNAVNFANDKLLGNLGATILIHPKTIKDLGDEFEKAIADLRYGAIGINNWDGGIFLLGQCAWGSYPGNPMNNIQSGTGFVHNSYMFSKPQKNVVRGLFYPFPRSWLHGHFHVSPRPLWFVTNNNAHETGEKVARFAANPSWSKIPGIFISALKGAFAPYSN